MKINITELKIHNFMSYGDETFDFSKHKGLNLICGKNNDIPGSKNGAGKSSLANALTFAIFGDLPFSLKNENIVNRYTQDENMQVILSLEANEKKYKIVSGINKKTGYCKLYVTDEDGNESDISGSGVTETRNYIQNEIFHLDLDLFMRVMYLNSDSNYNFYNLTPANRKILIDKIFDTAIFNNAFKNIGSEIKNMETKEIVILQNSLLELNSTKADYEKRTTTFIEDNNKKLEKLELDYENTKKELDDRTIKIGKISSNAMEKCRKSLDILSNTITENNGKIKLYCQKIFQYKHERKTLDDNIKRNNEIITKSTKINNVLCDDCKKKASKYYKVDEFEDEIKSLTEKINEIDEKITLEESEITKLKEDATKKESNFKKLKTAYTEKLQKSDELNFEIRQLSNKESSLKTEIDNIKNSKNPYNELIENITQKIDNTSKKIDIKLNYLKHLKYAQNVVSPENLKRILISSMVNALNMEINNYLKKMGANFSVEFDDEMDSRFITNEKSDAEFHNFSSGEQARISIATCFAFRKFLTMRSNLNTNLLIIDEYIDGNIDSYAMDNIIDILRDISETNGQNIYVVSHRKELSPEIFDNIIQIEKTNNVSKINYIPK